MPSPKDSASILSETINNIEAVDDSLQPPVLTHTTNQMSKGGISTIESNLAEKPNLSHFKVLASYSFRQFFIKLAQKN